MFHKKRSRTKSPDSDERGGVVKPKFCTFHLKRRCLRIREGKQCFSIHFDDGDNDDGGEDDVRRRRSDDDGDDEEEEERLRRRGERSWRDEKRSHDYHRDEKRRYDDDRDDDRKRYDDDRRRYSDDRRRYDDDRRRYDDDRRRHDDDDDDRHFDRNSRRSSRSVDRPVELQKSSTDDLERTSSERKEAQQSPSDAIAEALSREQEKKSTCVYFIRGLCKRGHSCKFAHPEPDLRAIVQRQIWLKCCKRYPIECDGSNCSYMHVKQEDRLYYKQTGLINERILGHAIRKALQFDIPVKNNRSVCKNKLDGECTIFNCPFAHLTREEFIKVVLAEVKSEFMKSFGPSDCLFHSVEAQNAIIQVLLNPHALSVPPPPVLLPTMPAPSIVCPPAPAFSGSMQPQAINDYDLDQLIAEKLRLANEKIAEENEKYMKHVKALEEENLQILRVLDPEQPARSLEDIRKRILDLFEDINWNSSVKLFEKSLDYQHKKTSELPNLRGGQAQVMKPDSIGMPVIPQGTQSIIPQEMPPFNPTLGSLPPGLPVIPGPAPFNPMMGPAAPVVPIVPHMGPLAPPFPSVQNDLRFPVQDFKRGTVAHSKSEYNEDNYDSDPMEIVDDGASDMPAVEKRKVKQNTKRMSTSYDYRVPVSNGTSWNSGNANKPPPKVPHVDWAFKRHIQKVQEEGRKSSNYVPSKPTEDFETSQGSEENASSIEFDSLQNSHLKRPFEEHLQEIAPSNVDSDPVPKKPRKADQCKLVLVNISDSHDEPSLFEYFEKFGKVLKIDIRPYCIFLKFKDVVSVEEVLKKGAHHQVNGYELHVRQPGIKRGMSEDEALPDYRPRIIVDGLTEAHDPKSVEMYFSQFGKMTRILTKTKMAFITYADVSVAQQVIHQSEPHVVNGELVAVKQEVFKKLINNKKEEKVVLQCELKLYVGGLCPTCKEDDLRNYFSAFGEIQVIDIKINKNGICRGFGFITFCDPKVAEYVLSITHHEINGKPVIINVPKPHHKKAQLKLVEPVLGVNMTKNLKENSSVEEVGDTEKLADELVLIQAQELGLLEELEQEEEEDELNEKGSELSKDIREENLRGDYVRNKMSLEIDNEGTEPDEKVRPTEKCDRLYVGSLDKTCSDDDLWNYFSCFGKIQELDVKRNKKGLCRGFAFITFSDSKASDSAVLKDDHNIKGMAITVKYAEPHIKKGPRQEKQEEKRPLESESARSEVLDQPLQSPVLEEEHNEILEEEFDDYNREEPDFMEEQCENNMEKLYEYEENIFGIDTEIYDEGAS